MLSFVLFVLVLGLFSVFGDSRDSSIWVVVAAEGTTSGIRASRFRLGFLKIRKGSRSDSVEIVCRSQIRGIGVCGIVCRSQEDARRARGICGEVDPE